MQVFFAPSTVSVFTHTKMLADRSYREGDIRLVGGPNNWEGRLEIFWSGKWGTVSDSQWTNNEARVTCRQLQHALESGRSMCVRTPVYIPATLSCVLV